MDHQPQPFLAPQQDVLLQWTFPEVARHERGPVWYFMTGMAIVVLVGFGILTKNFLFSFIIFLAALTFFLMYRNPRELECVITGEGVFIGRKFHAYRDIDKFWIIYEPPQVKTLYFRFKRGFIPLVSIALEEQNPVEVRLTLLRYIKEDLEQEEEPSVDTLTRLLKL